ncbi:MAG: NADH-quinone oxidoreductase subunit L [bacterium]
MLQHGQPILWLIPALPAAGAALIFLFSKQMSGRAAGRIACVSVTLCFGWVLFCSSLLLTWPGGNMLFFHEKICQWLDAGPIQSDISFYFDRIALVFSIIVSGVGLLIHIYSCEYMDGDEGMRRYFGYMNLFVASMLVLVMADNALFMFVGWEGVGACSFFLIGHWYQKSENCVAAQKAFLVTRLGDIFLLIGLLLCARLAGVSYLNMSGFAQIDDMKSVAEFGGIQGSTLITIAALLLLGGAVGKSAQLPLQTWLPDAMAGPTPVSALIHAATMVTAGVYLVARFHALFALSPAAMLTVAFIGAATALYAATCAIVQTDIKRILAYSTISQIGFMVLGLGVGAFSPGIFHFFTHAFYKALLFLAAGAVIHALHGEQNIFNMGGLKQPLKGIYLAFLAGAASLAGIPFITAGFWSKDAILWSALTTRYGNAGLYAAGLATALLTSIYSFRLVCIVFFGNPRKEHHIHPPGPLLSWPLYILAFFAIVAGFINIPAVFGAHPAWEHFFTPVFGEDQAESLVHSSGYEITATLGSGALAIIGALIAWRLYAPKREPIPAPASEIGSVLTETPSPYRSSLANDLFHGWRFDALYDALFVRTFRIAAAVLGWFDRTIVDGIFELAAAIVRGFNTLFLFFQNSRIPRYALVMLAGAVVITTIVIMSIPR